MTAKAGFIENACPLCSAVGYSVLHNGRCERDPTLLANVIASYFEQKGGSYVGIVWKAIANGAVRALEDAGYKIVEPEKIS